MTQLSLFDLPAASITSATALSGSHGIVTVEPSTFSVPVPAAKTEAAPKRRRRRRKGSASQTSSQNDVEGVQRMGDLARLVLMRYELAAQQRAIVAQRKADWEASRRQLAK